MSLWWARNQHEAIAWAGGILGVLAVVYNLAALLVAGVILYAIACYRGR